MNARRDGTRLPSAPAPHQPVTLSDETMQRVLSLQEQRIQLELKQADIALREIDHNQKLADKTISAQAEDLKDERAHSRLMSRQRLTFAALALVLVIGFSCYAVYMGREAIVLDIVKVVLGFVGGWGGSVIWQNRKGAEPPQQGR